MSRVVRLKRKYKKRIYKEAPKKSAVSKFFTSFFVTLAVLLSVIGFFVVYYNSKTLGFGKTCEVFNVIDNEKKVGFTFLDSDYSIDRTYLDTALSVKDDINDFFLFLKPAGARLFEKSVEVGTTRLKDYVDKNLDLNKFFEEYS